MGKLRENCSRGVWLLLLKQIADGLYPFVFRYITPLKLIQQPGQTGSAQQLRPTVNSFAAEGNYSRQHSMADVGDYRRRIYAIYVGGT